MYESLPLGEVDSRVGHIARHEKDTAKNAEGTDQEQEDSEVHLLLPVTSSLCDTPRPLSAFISRQGCKRQASVLNSSLL